MVDVKVKAKLDIRNKRPQTLASAFGGLIKIFGGRASDSDLLARWGDIMGDEIAGITKLVGIKRGPDKKITVVIRPANPAFALQLSYQVPEITNRINKYYGYAIAHKITIRKS